MGSVRTLLLASLLALLAMAGGSPAHAVLPARPAAAAMSRGFPDKPISVFYRETWTTRQGLPHNQIKAIAQTPDGYIWLGTWEGLVRYNGLEFQLFDRSNTPALRDNGVRSLRVAANGAVVIGTARGGVTVKQGDHWQTWGEADGLAQDEVLDALLDRAGRLWVATESKGLTLLDHGKVTQFNRGNGRLPGDVVAAIEEDRDGSLWVATTGGLVHVVDGRATTLGVAAGLPDAPLLRLLQRRDGTLLVGTERGVYRRIGGDQFTPLSSALPNDAVPSLAEDGDGKLWVGTVNNGLFRLDAGGIEHFTSRHELPNNRVASLLVDRDQSLWVGTDAGLMRLSNPPFTTWSVDQGLTDDYVRAVAESRHGGIWVGTGRGLNLWRDDAIVAHYTHADGLPGDSILSLLEVPDGSLLVGTYTDGVLRLRDGKVVARYDNAAGMPGSNQVRALAIGGDGDVWIGTTRGLVRLRDGKYHRVDLGPSLPRAFVTALLTARDGSLWVATSDGAARVVNDQVHPLDVHSLRGTQVVFGFHEDADGTVWMATDRGLLRERNGRLAGIGLENGLPVDTLFAVVDDGLGSFWLTSNRGVLRVARSEVDAVLAGRHHRLAFDHFGEVDGLVSAQCNGGSGPSALRDTRGRLWVATARGVAMVAPGALQAYRRPLPHVVLEQVLANDKPLPFDRTLHLPAGTRKLEFRYVAPNFMMPRFLRYRHRLVGVDDDWTERGSERLAQYTNLGPGRYRFEVEVSAPGLGQGWSRDITSINVEIAPYPWQRRGFIVAAVLLGLLLAYGFYRWRVGSLRRHAVQLEVMVAQRTADLHAQTERLRESDHEKSVLLDRLRQQSQAFERMAHEDALTGIGNRRSMDSRLAQVFQRAVRKNQPLSFALFDIDRFKQVNDSYSHDAGDRALIAVAHALRDGVGLPDMVARWGGEEFAVLLPGMPLEQARALCERLRQAVEAIDCSGYAPGWKLTVSVGVAERTGLGHHEKLVSRADTRLYEAKDDGRNRVCG